MSPSYKKSTWELLLQQTEPEGTISSLSGQSSHCSSVSLFVLLASNTAWSIPHGLVVTGSFAGCISTATALTAKGTEVGGGLIHFETFKTSYFYLDALGGLTDGWSRICVAIVRLPQSWSILDQHGCFSLCFPSCVKQLPLFSEDVGWNWHN